MKKIIIKNFKCFEDQEIEFRGLTILAGANGSGKSTVIQSILLFLQSKNSKQGFIDSLILNDYFIEAGIASDILFENAKEDFISFEIFFDEASLLYRYSIINRDDRILYSEDSKQFYDGLKKQIKKMPDGLMERVMRVNVEFMSTDFISADRFGPKLTYKINNEDTKVGKFGEFTPYIIDKHKSDILYNPKVYFDESKSSSSLLSEVNNWLSYILDGVKIDTSVLENANLSILKITNYSQAELDFKSPIHMPYGASYVLPIIVSCLLNSSATAHGKVIIENPEAHLHPSAQSKLGQFIAKIANSGVQIILETHSDHIINGIRIAIKHGIIENQHVIFNSFSKGEKLGENTVEEILIDENGKLNKWPKGFFDQYENDMLELL